MSVVEELRSILQNLEALTSGTSAPLQQSGGHATTAQYPPLSAFDAILTEFKEASTHVTEAPLKEIVSIHQHSID
jgi:hypothetical protein